MSAVPFSWAQNAETYVTGYQLYWGRASGVYDGPGSPRTFTGTSGEIDIDETRTWFIALKAIASTTASAFSFELTLPLVLGCVSGRAN